MARHPRHRALARRVSFALVMALGWHLRAAAPACAQAPWDATLFVSPFPSPYLSDWETNPTIASLTVVNGGAVAQDVILYSEVRNQAGVVLTVGRSDPQTIEPGVPVIYSDLTQIAGTQEHDPATEDLVRRSGRLPEGDYVACVAVTDLSGFVLARACADFTITYPDPPMLIAPATGDLVSTAAPLFQWTPLQVPPEFTLQYVMQVAEVLPGQLPEAALSSNILLYENDDVGMTSLSYPIDALPLEAGKTYAWRVVAMDQNGYAASANGGSSEIWTFTYDDGTAEPPVGPRVAPTTLQLRVSKSTVPDVGDSAGVWVGNLEAGLAALCATSDQWAAGAVDTTLDFDVRAPFFSDDTVTVTIYYAVDSLGLRESEQWAFKGSSATRNWEYFARGDCDGPTDQPGLAGTLARIHWIAVRPRQYGLSDYLSAAFGWNQDSVSAGGGRPPHEGIELDFGAGVLSLRSTTVGEGDLFPAEAEYFDGNAFDVLPGLNAYGIAWLPEGSIWQWLRQWGWDENTFELQGFVGMANTVTVGLELEKSRGGEADVTLQQKFLVLRLGLPKRTPQLIPWIRSMQGGIEFSVEDTLTTGVGPGTETKAGLDFILKFTWTWEISDDVSIVWAGGFDRNIERDASNAEAERKVDLILSGECACVWQPAFGLEQLWIGNPKLEMHYNLTERNALSVAGAFQIGLGEAPPVAVGGSLSWDKKVDSLPSPVREVHAMTQGAKRQELAALEKLKMLEADGAPLAELDSARAVLRRAQRLSETFEEELERVAKANNVDLERGARWNWRHPEWRVRVAAGNVGFAELLDFVRSLW